MPSRYLLYSYEIELTYVGNSDDNNLYAGGNGSNRINVGTGNPVLVQAMEQIMIVLMVQVMINMLVDITGDNKHSILITKDGKCK